MDPQCLPDTTLPFRRHWKYLLGKVQPGSVTQQEPVSGEAEVETAAGLGLAGPQSQVLLSAQALSWRVQGLCTAQGAGAAPVQSLTERALGHLLFGRPKHRAGRAGGLPSAGSAPSPNVAG